MADNFTANEGSGGDTFQADDIGAYKIPGAKITLGADNSDDGYVSSSNPMPVDGSGVTQPVSASSLPLPSGASTADNQSTANTALAAIQTAVEGTLTVTGGGGGTEYTEDAAAAANPVGTALILVREDARAGSLTTADGDNIALRGNNNGEAYVKATDTDALLTTIDNDTGNMLTALQIMDDWDESDRAKVNLIVGQAGIAAGAGAVGVTVPRITLASDDPAVALLGTIDTDTSVLAGAVSGTEMQVDIVTSALPSGASTAANQATANGLLTTIAGDTTSIDGKITACNTGAVVLAAGTALAADVGISGARTSGGTTIFRSLDLDETEEEIKGTAGQLYWVHCMNLTAAVVYLKLYNATAANVTVGTTTPVLTFPIATQGDTNGAGFTIAIPNGIAFSTAITAAVTTGIADNDTTGPAANGCVLNCGYA